MIVAFFKSHHEEQCKCEIVKFSDRIWIERNGDISCIRTFIVSVDKASPVPLTIVRMLTPHQEIRGLEDLTPTCLEKDYLFNTNSFSTGGYKIKTISPENNYGTIDYDFINNVEVYLDGLIKTYPANNGNGLVISCESAKNPIMPGALRMFRIRFKVTSQLDQIFQRVYNFSLTYFSNRELSETYKLMNIEKLMIKAVKIADELKKKGGFDIFLYLAEDLSSSNFNATTQTVGNHLSNGTVAKKKTQKFIWRARKIYEDSEVYYLEPGKNIIHLEGLINDPNELEEIRDNIGQLQKGNKSNFRIGIFAIVFTFITLIITLLLNDNLRDWIFPSSEPPNITDEISPAATEKNSLG